MISLARRPRGRFVAIFSDSSGAYLLILHCLDAVITAISTEASKAANPYTIEKLLNINDISISNMEINVKINVNFMVNQILSSLSISCLCAYYIVNIT